MGAVFRLKPYYACVLGPTSRRIGFYNECAFSSKTTYSLKTFLVYYCIICIVLSIEAACKGGPGGKLGFSTNHILYGPLCM